ncbi:hypothetical protein ZIOFF_022043 [Zingiber officinale]|uniref:Uncharacterized protein n=1 Tax=Zingiber officinale TaxID=94328 RepID=A0A8J5H299_ZINOF|nr:hypothetical protein ZIOFF_022043 [Zingiber officinale]
MEKKLLRMPQLELLRSMETVFHFLMSSLKYERSSYMLNIILKLLYTVISLQHSQRPRWALIDKAYMQNTWRLLQSSYRGFARMTIYLN